MSTLLTNKQKYMYYGKIVDFSVLKGKIIKEIRGLKAGSDEVTFITTDGCIYKMYHQQECCESVSINDFVGNIDDILNTPIEIAEERTSYNGHEGPIDRYDTSYTWTFYSLATVKGYLDIRWYGTSNGYYSESVEIYERTPQDFYS